MIFPDIVLFTKRTEDSNSAFTLYTLTSGYILYTSECFSYSTNKVDLFIDKECISLAIISFIFMTPLILQGETNN